MSQYLTNDKISFNEMFTHLQRIKIIPSSQYSSWQIDRAQSKSSKLRSANVDMPALATQFSDDAHNHLADFTTVARSS